MTKIVPLLADLLLEPAANSSKTIEPRKFQGLQQVLRKAEKFVLSDEAAIRVGQAIKAYPEMVIDHAQFAIPPFETCWIEYNGPRLVGQLTSEASASAADKTVGYLFHDGVVYVGVESFDKTFAFTGIAYHLNSDNSFHKEHEFAEKLGINRGKFNEFYMGVAQSARIPEEKLRKFREEHWVEWILTPEVTKQIRGTSSGFEVIYGCAGELRNIVGILLMLNQPSNVTYVGEKSPNRRILTSKGTKVRASHSVIEINLNHAPLTILLGKPSGIRGSVIQHKVRGTFAHHNLDRSCEHYWEAEDAHHFTCANCEGKRWWRKAHQRGDASKGTNIQERHLVFE
jgi:hypothetical protein